jgi:hypothetical protein
VRVVNEDLLEAVAPDFIENVEEQIHEQGGLEVKRSGKALGFVDLPEVRTVGRPLPARSDARQAILWR